MKSKLKKLEIILSHQHLIYFITLYLWCDLGKHVTCCKGWNSKIKEINIIIQMFFFIFHSLWTSITFDTSIRGDPHKKFWKENNSNFYVIPITNNSKCKFYTMWPWWRVFSDHFTFSYFRHFYFLNLSVDYFLSRLRKNGTNFFRFNS